MGSDSSSTQSRIFKASRNLALSTFISRVLGFARELLTAQFIGGSELMDGWALTKHIAVIFRRLLGEGELGKAIVPFISASMKEEGAERAKQRFLTILIWAALLLAALSLLISVPAYLLADHIENNNWHIACRLLPIIMPYSIFICLVGIIASYLNCVKEYFLPSLTAVIENIILIIALYLVCSRFDGITQLKALSLSIVGAGMLELLFMAFLLHRHNMLKSILSLTLIKDVDTIRKIWKIILPGFIAVSALQLSTLCDQWIASLLESGAASSIYYSGRLYQLPVAIFAVSFATVANTEMSHAAAQKDFALFTNTFLRTLKTLLFIAIPSAFFIACFSEDIIVFLFQHGKFDAKATAMTWYPLSVYASGIPFFCVYKVVSMSFTARRSMKIPCAVSIFCILLNIILNLLLMRPFRQGGIALATVLSSFANNFILIFLYNKSMPDHKLDILATIRFTVKTVLISALPLLPCRLLFSRGGGFITNTFIALPSAGILYLVGFLILAKLFRFPEAETVLSKFSKRRTRKT